MISQPRLDKIQRNLLVEKAERLAEFLLEGLLVDGVGDSVHECAELIELQLS